MRDLIKHKCRKRKSKVYFRNIVTTSDLNDFKKMTEKYRKHRRVYYISETCPNLLSGGIIEYAYLELRTLKKIYRYISFTLPYVGD